MFYTAPLAVKEVQKMIRQEHITGVRVHSVKRNEKKAYRQKKSCFLPKLRMLIQEHLV